MDDKKIYSFKISGNVTFKPMPCNICGNFTHDDDMLCDYCRADPKGYEKFLKENDGDNNGR